MASQLRNFCPDDLARGARRDSPAEREGGDQAEAMRGSSANVQRTAVRSMVLDRHSQTDPACGRTGSLKGVRACNTAFAESSLAARISRSISSSPIWRSTSAFDEDLARLEASFPRAGGLVGIPEEPEAALALAAVLASEWQRLAEEQPQVSPA